MNFVLVDNLKKEQRGKEEDQEYQSSNGTGLKCDTGEIGQIIWYLTLFKRTVSLELAHLIRKKVKKWVHTTIFKFAIKKHLRSKLELWFISEFNGPLLDWATAKCQFQHQGQESLQLAESSSNKGSSQKSAKSDLFVGLFQASHKIHNQKLDDDVVNYFHSTTWKNACSISDSQKRQ